MCSGPVFTSHPAKLWSQWRWRYCFGCRQPPAP